MLKLLISGLGVFIASAISYVSGAPLQIVLAMQLFSGYYLIKTAIAYNGRTVNPLSLFVIMSSLYIFSGAVEACYLGNRLGLDEDLMIYYSQLGLVYLSMSLIGFIITSIKDKFHNFAIDAGMIRIFRRANFFLLLAISISAISTFGLNIGDYTRFEIYSSNITLMTFGRSVFVIWIVIYCVSIHAREEFLGQKMIRDRILAGLMVLIYLGLDTLILGDRRLFVTGFLAAGVIIFPKKIGVVRGLVLSIVAAMFLLLGFVRNSPISRWGEILFDGDLAVAISPASNEFGGIAIIGSLVGRAESVAPNFPNYLQSIGQQFPRAIYPDRPLAPTEWFAKNYFYDIYVDGGSYAFNSIIEANINGGLLAIVLIGFLLGVAIKKLTGVYFRGLPVGACLCVFIFCFSMRMDFSSILKTALHSSVGLAILVLISTASIGRSAAGGRTS